MKRYRTERELQAKTLLKDGDYVSIRQMIGRVAALMPAAPLLAELDKEKKIKYHTASDVYEAFMNLGDGLIAAGLRGAHIAIVSENCCRYVIADMTVSSGVGVVTPIDCNAPLPLLVTLLDKCDADAAFCDSAHLDILLEAQKQCPRLRTLITLDQKVGDFPYYGEIIAAGAARKDRSVFRTLEPDLEAPAKILFTSGTTGVNKGVVLSNANLAANMVNCMDVILAQPHNTSMSILPMHHATEINTHIMARIGSGRLTYINGNMRQMMANIRIFKPDIITVVPMVANAFYKNIWATARKEGKADKLARGIKLSNFLRRFGIDITHRLFADLYKPFGGNLYMIVCGGSMLNPVVIRGMNDLGIRIENGYGITECGPLISMNADTLDEHLSVGRPCPQLEVRIDSPDENGIGELCVRGKSVARGYYKDPEASAAVFGADGFFNTGDSAWLDPKGRIMLVGRKKNTIVLPSGKNVCPEEVENVLESALEDVDEIVVYQAEMVSGSFSRPLLCAGMYISDPARRADRAALIREIGRVNDTLPAYKRIEYVELPDAPYERTATRKIKRTLLPATCSGNGIIIA